MAITPAIAANTAPTCGIVILSSTLLRYKVHFTGIQNVGVKQLTL